MYLNTSAAMLAGLLLASSVHAQNEADADRARPGIVVMVQLQDSSYILGQHSTLSKEELMKARGIALDVRPGYPEGDLKVVGFTLTVDLNDAPLEASSTDDRLTDAQRALIRLVSSGSKVYLENIRVRDGTGPIYHAPSQAILVR